MNRRKFIATVGSLHVGLSGCVSATSSSRSPDEAGDFLDPIPGTWPTYQFDSGRTGYNPHLGTRHGDPDGRWSVPMSVSGTPAVADGTVYVGSYDGFLSAMDATTGEEQWRFTVESDLESTFWATPALAGDTLYAHCDAGVFALDRTSGEEQWRVLPEVKPLRPETLAIVEDTVYVERAVTAVAAIDAATGDERWRYDTADYGIRSSLAIADDTVYFSAVDGSVHAVDAGTGERRWRQVIGGGYVRELTVSGSTVFLTSHIVYALDAESGERRWTFDIREQAPVDPNSSRDRQSGSGGSSASPPAVADGTLYVKIEEGHVLAVDAETGEFAWIADVNGSLRAPIVVEELVYVAGENAIRALDASSGEPSGWVFRPRGWPSTDPVVVDGVLFTGTRGNDQDFLYALTGSKNA